MIRNYFVVVLRNISKNLLFSFINILGLVIGITCSLLIYIFVSDELSYDKFHKDSKDIYRVALHGKLSGREIYTTTTCPPLADAMRSEIPGIEKTVRLISASQGAGITFRNDDKSFSEEKVFYSDSTFFDFFSFPLIYGNPKTVLREPNTVVITKELADKYFGDTNAIGKILVVGRSKTAFKVTGIAQPPPHNSHFQFKAILSVYGYGVENFNLEHWTSNYIHTYVRKTPSVSVEEINNKLDGLVGKYVATEILTAIGTSWEQFTKDGGIYSYYIYPLEDSHLYSGLNDDLEPNGQIRNVYAFIAVGLFILLIACINFMNLSTAQSATRAKEVGLRKTLGSVSKNLIAQFIFESLIYSFIAMLLAVLLAYLVLPYFNLLSGKYLTLSTILDFRFMAVAILLFLFVGLVGGSYPAFYLSSFNPSEVLKGKIRAGLKSKTLRSALVIFQFSISTLLIIITIVVFRQLEFMRNKDLGMDKENVMVVSGTKRLEEKRKAFKDIIETESSVVKSSYTSNDFPGINNRTVVKKKEEASDHLVSMYFADWDQLDVLKMRLKAGRFFSREFKSDSNAVVINEAAVKEYGLDNPLAAELTTYDTDAPLNVKIIGVLEDFNYESLKEKVAPLVIRFSDINWSLLIRFTGNPSDIVSKIKAHWETFAPGEPFEYSFMDDDFDALFRSEMRLKNIFTVFSVIAIVIACLGLFALSSFTTEQRKKEIGLRKALGSTVSSLVVLLSKEFTKLVLIAIIPASIVGWLIANWWLKDFAYRIQLDAIIFVGSGLTAIIIGCLTVAYKSIKASISNPIDSLRYE